MILFKISCVLFSGEHFVMCKCCEFCQIAEIANNKPCESLQLSVVRVLLVKLVCLAYLTSGSQGTALAEDSCLWMCFRGCLPPLSNHC